MPIPEAAVKNGAPATQNAGGNPADIKTFEDKANEILASLTGETPSEKEEEKKEEHKKEEEKETPSEKKEEPKKEEENKIPLSRLNKEIDKRKSVEEELNIVKQKLAKEQERIKSLSEDELEEQESYKRLGLETKEDKLQDKLEDLERELKLSGEKIKSYEEELNSVKVNKLSKRIGDLTKEYDGKNGLPKFDIQELLEFGKQENYMPEDPFKLYNLKYQNEIVAQKYKANTDSKNEVDRGNKETFAPMKKKISGFEDPEFEKEAMDIINSIS